MMTRLALLLLLLPIVQRVRAAALPLTVQRLSGLPADGRSGGQMVSWGIPLPRGAVTSSDHLRLVCGEQEVAAQFDPMATWDHGKSLKWVLVTATFDATKPQDYRLEYGPTVKESVPRAALTLQQTESGYTVDTGGLRCEVLRRTGMVGNVRLVRRGEEWPLIGQADLYLAAAGTNYEGRYSAGPAEVRVLRQGPLMAALRCEGWYEQNGSKLCKHVTRLTFHAGSSLVQVSHTFVMTEPSGRATFADIGLTLPLLGYWAGQFGLDGKSHPAPAVAGPGPAYLRQDGPDHCLYLGPDGQQEGRQADGWMVARSRRDDAFVALAVRDAWQNYPLEWALSNTDMTLHVWPEHGRETDLHPVTLENINKLWFVHEGKLLDFAVPQTVYSFMDKGVENDYRYVRSAEKANAIGIAKTHEFSLLLAAEGDPTAQARDLARQVNDPLVVSLSGKDMCASGAFDDLHPAGDPPFAAVDKSMRDFFTAERRLEAYCGSFGKWNWGDSHTSWRWDGLRFDTIYRTWRNTHHGAPRVPWILWARSADPVFLQYGLRNARHVLDIDYCHHSTPELEGLEYPIGKIAGALNDYKGLVHWHSGNRLFDYNNMTDFALWYSYVSGDDRGLELAQQWGAKLATRFTSPTGNREGAGTCEALLTLYQATWDERYLKLAHKYAETLIKSQLMNGDMPQWENYAPWLERYLTLVAPTGEAPDAARYEPAKACAVRWADAFLAGGGDSSAAPGNGWAYFNILAVAYRLTGDGKYLAEGLGNLSVILASTYDDPSQPWHGWWSAAGGGSLAGYDLQRIPYFLSAVARHGRPVQPAYPDCSIQTDTWYLDVTPAQPFNLKLIGTAFEAGKATLLGPKGEPVKVWELAKGEVKLAEAVPGSAGPGVYRLQLAPYKAFMLQTPLTDLPREMAGVPAEGLNAMRGSRLYFLVPAGCSEVKVQVTGRFWPQTFFLLDPEGQQVARRDWDEFKGPKPQTLVIKPTAAQQGKLWCLVQGLTKNMIFRFETPPGQPPVPTYVAVTEARRFWQLP